MDTQWILNALFMLVGALGGIIYRDIRKDMTKQDELLSQLAEKVHSVDMFIVGNYVHKDDFKDMTNTLFSKLDAIYDKLDKKADK